VSVAWAILEAVRNALALDPALVGVSIRLRKTPYVDQDRDTLPVVVISPEAERPVEEAYGGTAQVDYPVLVMHVQAGGSTMEDETALRRQLDAREAVRRLHGPTLSGAPTVYDSTYEPDPPYDTAALDAQHDVSVQRLVFRSDEPREPTP
jgi:hypothetical protein